MRVKDVLEMVNDELLASIENLFRSYGHTSPGFMFRKWIWIPWPFSAGSWVRRQKYGDGFNCIFVLLRNDVP